MSESVQLQPETSQNHCIPITSSGAVSSHDFQYSMVAKATSAQILWGDHIQTNIDHEPRTKNSQWDWEEKTCDAQTQHDSTILTYTGYIELYSTAEIDWFCHISKPYQHPQFRQLHRSTSQLWATRRSGSLLYWPQPSFQRSFPQNSTCQESSKSQQSLQFLGTTRAMHCESCRLKYFIQFLRHWSSLLRKQTEIWCSGSKPFLTVVECESHELPSDKNRRWLQLLRLVPPCCQPKPSQEWSNLHWV